jgi:DNA repair protein RecN (Recombination protein N)
LSGTTESIVLQYIQIRNLAIIEEVELDLRAGMTVFTGETGAGKSILIEALGLALGDRADSAMVRNGAEQAVVSAIFTAPVDKEFRALLDEQGIALDDEVIVKRHVGADGRSRAFINGSPVPLTTLRTIGERFADIHGQHEHHSLLRRDTQRDLIDTFGEHEKLLVEVASVCRRVHEIAARLARLEGSHGNAEHEAELLRFQVSELKACQPTVEGIATLEMEHRRLANAGRLAEGCNQLLADLIDEERNAAALIECSAREVQSLARLDPAFTEIASMLESASIQIDEAAQWLRHYSDHLDADPKRVTQIESQIAILHDLSRKHRVATAELPAHLQRLEERLFELENGEELRKQLRTEHEAALKDYQAAAANLHKARRKAADKFAAAVSVSMHELGMPGGKFAVEVESLADSISPHGNDRIEFMVSANPGQPPRALAKIASGGELSRISLAVQVLIAKKRGAGGGVPTFVFDEVDVGIGGRVAEIVGRMLRELGANGQVLCVTHLPQVAALGHQHVQISKSVHNGQTRIAVEPLEKSARVDELARMLGGVTITKQTIAHARALLETSN